MISARDRILADINAALSSDRRDPAGVALELAALIDDPSAIQPKFDLAALEDRFIAKATSERVTATLSRAERFADIPDKVRSYLDEAEVPNRIALQPTNVLTSLDWAGIDTHCNPATDEPVAVTIADFGIAETGSVVFRSRGDAPTLFNFIPLHHVVVLETKQIVPCLEDFWTRAGEEGSPHPRSVNIVTGTSGTADIEAKNVRGAHGPRHMRIILVG